MQAKQSPISPLVTIMIPTYLQEEVILDAVDSALAQDYPNLEIIVADDASPDRTSERVAQRNDPRLRYHCNPLNLGRVANYRNTLYNLAKGDWVVNLDGDDYYTEPTFISRAIQIALSEQDVVIVSANRQVLFEGGVMPPPQRPVAKIASGYEVVSNVYDRRYHFFHMATLYKRTTALELDFYRKDIVSSDWESLYRLAMHGKVAFMDMVVGFWRLTNGNASMSLDWLSLASNLSIWNAIFKEAALKINNPFRLYISKQRMLFSMTYMYFFNMASSGSPSWVLLKYLYAVRRYAGAMTIFLLFFYYKFFFWLAFSILSSCRLAYNRRSEL